MKWLNIQNQLQDQDETQREQGEKLNHELQGEKLNQTTNKQHGEESFSKYFCYLIVLILSL